MNESDDLGSPVDHPGDAGHQRLRTSLGAYALGHLSGQERAEVDAHLAGCGSCRAELAEIAPAATALARLRTSRPEVAGPPFDLGARVQQSVARERRGDERRRVTALAGLVAAAAVVLGVAAGATYGLTRPQPAPVAAVPLEQVPVSPQQGIDAVADLVAHTWGVEVRLEATGFTAGERYRVAVLGSDGTSYDAGEFVGTGATQVRCNLSSSVLRAQAAGFVVRDPGGDVVLRSRF